MGNGVIGAGKAGQTAYTGKQGVTSTTEQQGAQMQCGANMHMEPEAPAKKAWGSNATETPSGAFVPKTQSRGVPAAALPQVEISSLSAPDRKKVADLWKSFGPKMVPMHETWHSTHGSGGTRGPGSGEVFMQFHANLMKDFSKVIETKDPALFKKLNGQLPVWDTTKALPKEFHFPDMDPKTKGPKGIDWKAPSYLSAKGGTESFVLKDAQPPKTIKSLNDIKSVDELGRVLGASGVHAVGHIRLAGKMGGFASIATPPFQLWHGKMEEIRKEWLTTPSGKAAAKAHPPEGFADANANSHDSAMQAQHGMRGLAGAGRPISDSEFVNEMRSLERQQKRASEQ